VTLVVSQGTMSAGGAKVCSRCGRSRDQGKQRYCKLCHAQYCRDRRAGMVEVLLTREEWAAVKAERARLPPLPPGP